MLYELSIHPGGEDVMEATVRCEELRLSQELRNDILLLAEVANVTCEELLQHALSEIRSLPENDHILGRVSESSTVVG